jgi:peroxiredoxin
MIRKQLHTRRTLASLILALGLILLGVASILLLSNGLGVENQDPLADEPDCVQPVSVDFPAPSISLVDLSLSKVELQDYQGDVVLINTWTTWCPPCIAEMPELQAYYEKYQEEDFTLIGVNIGETRDQVLEFALKNRLTFPLWLDTDEASLRALNTISLPYSIVIDRGGTVRYAWSGATCISALDQSVTPLIAQ